MNAEKFQNSILLRFLAGSPEGVVSPMLHDLKPHYKGENAQIKQK